MQDEATILSALQQGVTAAIAQSDNTALPVKYLLVNENDGTQWTGVPQDGKWLELVWIPNNREDFWGTELNHAGLFRLILHWPNTGGGVYAPVVLMASITRYFAKGRLLSGVQIAARPGTSNFIEDGDEVLFPVSIAYQSFRQGV